MPGRLAGHVAVVTGGSHGLGRATVRAFTDEGASVCVVDLDDPGVHDGRPEVCTITGDIATEGLVAAAIDEAAGRFGPVTILVNDAASYPNASMTDMPLDEWRRVFDVNVHGTFQACQAFARHRVTVDPGHEVPASIVSISTGSARSPRPNGGAYSASKAAVETMSAVLAMELGPLNTRSNVVAPGYIDVRGWSEANPDRATDDMRAALTAQIPVGVAGLPDDIAAAVVFLCSPAARHINGIVLPVDGGSIAGRFTLASQPPVAAGQR
jgi:NAD(P)-dependent dehydrogenase (short-subunit alcohol dehydrogenase family)